MPDVSVIIVTYDARDLIDRCLEAVLGAGGAGVDLEVIVVDNDSTDDTVDHVQKAWIEQSSDTRVRLIPTGRNGGMAAGNNTGMLAASGDSFLLLNSDAFLEPGSLRRMVDALRDAGAEHVAAIAPALRNTDGSPQRSVRGFPSVWRYATELLYLRRLAPGSRWANAFYGGGLDLSQPRTIEWATGACLLVPRAAVDAVGLMDEAYVMYGEEVDWLRRMQRAGLRVLWEPRAEVVHIGGGSAKRAWSRWYGVQLANHVRYMARQEGTRAARRTRRLLLASLRVRAAAYRVLGQRERSDAFARGRAAVAAVDPARTADPIVPDWPGATRRPPTSIAGVED